MLCSMHVHDHGVSNGNVLHADTHAFSISLPSNYIRKMADDGYEILFFGQPLPLEWKKKNNKRNRSMRERGRCPVNANSNSGVLRYGSRAPSCGNVFNLIL